MDELAKKRPRLLLLAMTVAAYILISVVVGNWVRTLIIFPAYAFVFLFTYRMVLWQRKPRD